MAAVPVYDGNFGVRQAERLLWRAGFGGDHEKAQRLAGKGLRDAVRSLTRPPAVRLNGPEPTDDEGRDVLFWLDRMVRTNQPFVERMALIWHDWFATGDVGSQRFSLGQYKLFRRHGLGSFSELVRASSPLPPTKED